MWIYYNSSKQNELVRLVREVIDSTGEHVERCRRSKKGPLRTVIYERIKLALVGDLAKELVEGTVESVMIEGDASRTVRTVTKAR